MSKQRYVAGTLLFLALVSSAQAQDQSCSVMAGPARPLTRAEVIADLRLWQRAGLNRFDNPYLQDVFDEAYQQALQRYFKLRNGQEYLEEVLRVTSESD